MWASSMLSRQPCLAEAPQVSPGQQLSELRKTSQDYPINWFSLHSVSQCFTTLHNYIRCLALALKGPHSKPLSVLSFTKQALGSPNNKKARVIVSHKFELLYFHFDFSPFRGHFLLGQFLHVQRMLSDLLSLNLRFATGANTSSR